MSRCEEGRFRKAGDEERLRQCGVGCCTGEGVGVSVTIRCVSWGKVLGGGRKVKVKERGVGQL